MDCLVFIGKIFEIKDIERFKEIKLKEKEEINAEENDLLIKIHYRFKKVFRKIESPLINKEYILEFFGIPKALKI